MKQRTYGIGEASRLSGVSVRRLRFYADKGLLPPAGRTESGYRVFTDSELVRLDLIRCLRDAGLGLEAIREVLSHELSLNEALRLRLQALEVEIAAQRRVASALRAALRSPKLSQADLRRYWTMTTLSRAERRNVVERFYQQVSEDTDIDLAWMREKIESSVPERPDEPTPEQCDAWIELASILNDPGFVANMRSSVKALGIPTPSTRMLISGHRNTSPSGPARPSRRGLSRPRRPVTHWLANCLKLPQG
jgi:DNA-binding transcriptional MerR regulator